MLNRPSPEIVAETESEVEVMDEISSGPITKAEIRSAIVSMGAGKAPGVDGITVELFKADMTTTVEALHDLFCGFIYECLSRFLQIGRRVLLSGYSRKGILLSVETGGG